jgi:hypothetical protein
LRQISVDSPIFTVAGHHRLEIVPSKCILIVEDVVQEITHVVLDYRQPVRLRSRRSMFFGVSSQGRVCLEEENFVWLLSSCEVPRLREMLSTLSCPHGGQLYR